LIIGADIIAKNQSFLEVNPSDKQYANVRAILLDPTCSGSGMVNQLDHLSDETRTWKLNPSWKISDTSKSVEFMLLYFKLNIP
jgi:16S rRNA C967 or C1407 C5-methylase (RsmB/RsmF family)